MVIDSPAGSGGTDPRKLLALNEQVKELFGIDLAEKLGQLGVPGPRVEVSVPTRSVEPPPAPGDPDLRN